MLSRWSHRFSIALELNALSKEGTFRFRPALMNNGGSSQMSRFFRALSIFFAKFCGHVVAPERHPL
jgi:hypothetical protein